MKPVDHMPDEWSCVLQKAFAHVTKFFSDDHLLALHDIKRALVSGRVVAMVRPLTDISKGCVLPVEFWQKHKLSSIGLKFDSDFYSRGLCRSNCKDQCQTQQDQ